MRAGTIVAGVIVFLLGLAGLAELFGEAFLPFSLAIVSAYLTASGALILFGAVTVIGLGLIIGGIVARPAVVVVASGVMAATEPVGSRVVYEVLSDLELTVLRYLSQGKSASEISNITAVANSTISEKITVLRARGYITDKNTLTEKGFEALHRTETTPPRAIP